MLLALGDVDDLDRVGQTHLFQGDTDFATIWRIVSEKLDRHRVAPAALWGTRGARPRVRCEMIEAPDFITARTVKTKENTQLDCAHKLGMRLFNPNA